jgi:hypothetical protein
VLKNSNFRIDHNSGDRWRVVCVESRQAYQALKSLATHKTDRNDA